MKKLFLLASLLCGLVSCGGSLLGSGENPTIKYWLEVKTPEVMSRLIIIRSTSDWPPASINWSPPDELQMPDSVLHKESVLLTFKSAGLQHVAVSFMTPAGDAFHELDTTLQL
jgi:hypothetical protein